MKNKISTLLALVFFIGFWACKPAPRQITSITTKAIPVDSTFDAVSDSTYMHYLQPFKTELDGKMNGIIGTTPYKLTLARPESLLSNWASDVLRTAASLYLGKKVDAAVVNMGGLRCDIAQGNILLRNMYELMPFDNQMVLLTLTGEDMTELCNNIARRGGEGISGLRFEINANQQAQNIILNGKAIVATRHYTVATSDYLAAGNDGMSALARCISKQETGLKIRDVFIVFVEKQTADGKEITSVLDKRILVVK